MYFRSFFTSLAFLSRLWPSRIIAGADFARCLPWFPLTGLVIGLVTVLPVWLGFFGGHSWLMGWLTVAMSLWLTRGLHADAVADIGDAWGSGARGERFWTIVKDSRIGAFGVVWLVMALLGQAASFGTLAGQGRLGAIVWCFVLGRGLSVAALYLCRDLVRPGLSALFAPGATPRAVGSVAAQTILLGLLLTSPRGLILGVAVSAFVLLFLVRLSRRQGGFNGDFMGACILLGELAGALAALL